MVDSGVPQGSVLGPILFLVYVDDAARDLDCEVAMFADDMKIWSVLRGPADKDRLEMNLNRLEEWSNRWLLRFNVAKCSILRLGNTARSASTRGYFLGGAALQEVEAQKDLGVLTTSSLKPSAHCSRVAKTAMSVLEVDSNPFRPDGELSREAELLLKHSTIQRDKVIINDPAIRPVNGLALSPDGSVSPAGDVCGTAENHLSPTKASGVCASDNNSSQIRTGEVKSGQVPADVGDAVRSCQLLLSSLANHRLVRISVKLSTMSHAPLPPLPRNNLLPTTTLH
nr:unnamed protein product [Spirometra erinaceieuropaei]